MHNSRLDIHHITRVEGHGHIVLDVKNGKIADLRLNIIESPRFFEAMIRGKRYDEAQHITSRICGICAVGHTLASITATEDAFGFTPSEQTILLRKLTLNGEMIQSHILHLYFLVSPDFFHVGSVLPLAASNPDIVKRGLRLKKLGNDICAVTSGRHTHPISMAVGGFLHIPKIEELKELRKKLADAWGDIIETANTFKSFTIPDFTRDTEYISLKKDDEFALYDGKIFSSDTGIAEKKDYKNIIREFFVADSTAKHTKNNRESFMVGSLARINNNFDKLKDKAKGTAKLFGFTAPCYNPYMNNIAQLVETVHCVEDSINIIDALLTKGIANEDINFKVKAGRGVGAVEVPRGTLYHEYTYDSNGFIENANCIIPTGQNLANIQKDLEALVPQILNKSKEEISLAIEMLVRAYDPCISCSTHLMECEFI